MSDYLAIQAQAEKFEKLRLSSNVYELLPEPKPQVEAVFFHGLHRKGTDPKHAFWRTWKMRKSEDCWPEKLLPKLLEDEGMQYRARVLSITYENRPDPGKDGRGTDTSDEFLIIENLITELILQAKVGQKDGVPVVLVGHDLGGILIKQFVMMVDKRAANTPDDGEKAKLCKFLENLKSVFFYATPHYGSVAFDKMAGKLDSRDANQMLPLLKVLHNATARINSSFQIYRQRKNQLPHSGLRTHVMHAACVTKEGGFDDQVVEEGSARADADSFYSAQVDHFAICQPEGSWTTEVLMFGMEMKRVIKEMQSLDSANGSTQNKRERGLPDYQHAYDKMVCPSRRDHSNGVSRRKRF